jgi:lysophospholipase L1-like esterase
MTRWPLAWLAAAPLAPWLIAQGRRVRRVVPVLPEPPGDRCGHWRVTSVSLARSVDRPRVRLLMLGDSSMAGVGAPHQQLALSGALGGLMHQPERTTERTTKGTTERATDGITEGVIEVVWQVHARTGLRVRDTRSWLSTAPQPWGADIAVIALGVNDATALQSATGFRADARRLIAHLQQDWGIPRVFWCGLPPVHRFVALPQPLRAVLGRKAVELDAVLRTLGSDYLPMPARLDDDWIASDGFHPGPLAYQAWARAIATDLQAAIFQAAGFRASIRR